jgi:multicomponent Na+:H+ antiporter subunit G
MIEIITAILWVTGSVFALLAALGLVRMPDVFTRMQASTKASTLGLGCLVIGTALQLGDLASWIRAASIGAFIFLTTSVSAHVIARAAYLADVPLWEGTLVDERQRDARQDASAEQDVKGSGVSD